MIQSVSDAEINCFWRILPHEKQLLQKNRGASRLVYLFLFNWFKEKAHFPESVEAIPRDLIDHGIALSAEPILREDFLELFEQERSIKRYKQEIRKYFEFKAFDENNSLFQNFLMENVFKAKNDAILQSILCDYLKKIKIEMPDEPKLLKVIQRAKAEKEQQIFSQIYNILFEEICCIEACSISRSCASSCNPRQSKL